MKYSVSCGCSGILHHISMGDVHTKWALVKLTPCLECTKDTIFQIFHHRCELWIAHSNVCVYSCGRPSPLLTGLWREPVNWHGATRRPAWRPTHWYRTGWMIPCSGSSWPRSGKGCLGSGYGSEPPRTLCGATGGLTWGRQWDERIHTWEVVSRAKREKNTLKKLKWNLDWAWLFFKWLAESKSGEAITMGK